jgi:hypothetical protein
MSGLTEAWEEQELKRIVGKSPELDRFIALCTTAPTKSAGGTAATFTGYKRAKTKAADWEEPVGGSPSKILNKGEPSYTCSAAESVVTHFEIWTEEVGGERIAWGALKEPKTINASSTPATFAAGQLEVTCS